MVPAAAGGDATMVPMAPMAVAVQQQLGDDDEREARQLALLRDAETRLASLCALVPAPVFPEYWRPPSLVLRIIRINIVLIYITYSVFLHPVPDLPTYFQLPGAL